jgi:C-terminal processing protease CtpA/Prc
MRKLAWLIMMFMLSTIVSLAQNQSCFICQYDNKQCRGYFASNSCRVECNSCLADASPFEEANSTGILPEQRSGKLLVRMVVANSPAQHAGVEAGDEIISVNARKPGTYACRPVWSSDGQAAIVAIRRGSEDRVLRIPTVPIVAMLASHNLILSSLPAHNSFKLDAPFTFGFRWEAHSNYLEISQILAGSPADGAGLEAGDQIVPGGQDTLRESDSMDASSLIDSDTPRRVDIEVLHGAARTHVKLLSRGIAEILASPEQGKAVQQVQRASLK